MMFSYDALILKDSEWQMESKFLLDSRAYLNTLGELKSHDRKSARHSSGWLQTRMTSHLLG